MMRSLWTASSGMISQQFNVDTISNNLANVNTTAYKTERAEFKSLLYETLKAADQDGANQFGSPINLQVGHGVRPIAVSRIFTTGNWQRTDNPLDVAIEGKGFFTVQRGENEIAYTKDGTLKVSVVEDGLMLVTSDGYPLLSTDDAPIIFPPEMTVDDIKVNSDGTFYFVNTEGVPEDLGIQIKIVQFSNMQGLEAIGSNLFNVSPASGVPLIEADGDVTKPSKLIQGVLEMSNVQIATEMVNLIVAQRAYEINSKAIQTSDDMLQTANNLKR